MRWTTLDGSGLLPEEFRRLRDWITEQGFDAKRVPTDSYFAHDTATDEWVAEYYVEPRRVDPETDTVPRVRVRRKALSPAPLPFLAPA